MIFEARKSGRNIQRMQKREEKKRERRMLRSKIWLSVRISGQKGVFKRSVWRRLGWTARQTQRTLWFSHF